MLHRRALTELNHTVERFDKMQDVAVNQHSMYNESEARRIKQEINSLKFNTMEVDVKCRFLQCMLWLTNTCVETCWCVV